MKPPSIFNIFKNLTRNFFSNTSYMEKLVEKGVTIIDSNSTYIDESVSIESGTIVHPSTYILGDSEISSNCIIGPNSTISNTKISKKSNILYSIVLDSIIGENSNIGPFSYIRNNSIIENNVEIGNFVEVKASKIGNYSKSKHLSYLGDITIENNVNIGAGFVSANYDGKFKHKSTIKQNSFVGSNSTIVSPVEINKNAIVGAGSVVIDDVSEHSKVVGVPAKKIKPGGDIDN